MVYQLLRSFAILFFLSFTVDISLAQVPGVEAAVEQNQRIIQYSSDLSIIQDQIFEHFGVNSISIGGGTARALIQTVLQGKPFVFRDFDLVINAEQKVTDQRAYELGSALENKGLGRFSKENLRPRPRFNPDLENEKDARSYNAGYGFFVDSISGVEFDISLFHSKKDLALNGIMDVDRFQVVINRGESLLDLVKNQTLFLKHIIDPAGALPTLLENKIPKVSNWGEVIKDPSMVSIRIIRTLGKFNGLPMDALTAAKIKSLIKKYPEGHELQVARNLLKLFEDPNWHREFKALVDLGLFNNFFPSFAAALENQHFKEAKSVQEIIVKIFEKASAKDSLKFLKLLIDLEPELIQKSLPELIRIKKLKVGYYTGEFAPFHKGHESVVNTVLEKGDLSVVFVIPTPFATNNPKVEAYDSHEWSERQLLVKAGVEHLPTAWAWPLKIDHQKTTVTLDQTIRDVTLFVQAEKPLTHVFGMDSYYRVLHRNLVNTDPRPRIAVSRSGVPVPKKSPPQVRILENVKEEPHSATRIIHQIALTGKSDGVSAAVIKQLQKIPRYADYMTKSIESRNDAAQSVKAIEDYSTTTLVWDLRENRAGLWNPYFPVFSVEHAKMLIRLLALNPGKIIIPLPTSDYVSAETNRSWKNALKRLNLKNVTLWTEKDGHINETIVSVVHSGVINDHLKKKTFDYFYQGRGLIVFETPDQPISPLIRSIPTIKLLGAEAFRCEAMFSQAS